MLFSKPVRVVSLAAAASLMVGSVVCGAGDPYAMNAKLGRGVNFGNALDAPTEGEWGVVLREEFFDAAKEAGFDSIRLPVRWSAYAETEAPYTIDPEWFARVDWAIEQALSRDLPVILNVHHYRETYADPHPHKDRFLGLWKQIAPHYKDLPNDMVVFELMNEPDEELTPEIWNDWMPLALAIVRESNPDRTVMIGPGEDNTIEFLDTMKIPENDRNIIVTVHHYFPLAFTHQGAEWHRFPEMGVTWGTDDDMAVEEKVFDVAAAWAKKHDRPINLGEFGANKLGEMESRVNWTKAMADMAIERGFSFHYWEFCADWFGVYDQATQTFHEELLEVLVPGKMFIESAE
jgi:endoglucanase